MDPTDQTSSLTSFLAAAAPIVAALGAFLCGAAVTGLWVMSRRRRDEEEEEEPAPPRRARRDPRRRNQASAAPRPGRASPVFEAPEPAEEMPEPVQPRHANPAPPNPAPQSPAPASPPPASQPPAAAPTPQDEAAVAAHGALDRRLESFEKELRELQELLQLPPEQQDPGIYEYMAGSTAVTLEVLRAARQAHDDSLAAARPKPGPRPVAVVVESEPEPAEPAEMPHSEEEDADAPEADESPRPGGRSRRAGLSGRQEPPPLSDELRLDGGAEDIADPPAPPRRRRRGAAAEADPEDAPLPRGNRARALLRGGRD